MTVMANGQAQRIVVLGGFAEVAPGGTLTVLADLANPVEDFDRAVLAGQIAAQEEKIKELESGNALDRAIEKLDHFKEVDQHLEGTALH
jgi:F-type H+-transporting ATPase subunit epsilon